MSPRSEHPLPPFRVDDAARLAGPAWLREVRTAAAETFLAMPLPTTALEEWRYSRIDALYPASFGPAPPPDEMGSEPSDSDLASVLGALGAAQPLVETVNGHVRTSPISVSGPISASGPASVSGIEVEVLSAGGSRAVEQEAASGAGDAFATLNLAMSPDPLRLRISGRSSDPLVLLHRSAGTDLAVFPRVRIEVGEAAEAVVVEVVGGPGANLVVPVTELELARGARLTYLQAQLLGPGAWQIALQTSRVAAGAALASAAVALGGSYARLKTDSTLTGERAETRLLALYFGSGSQMHDFRTVQRHAARKTRSELLYKGVAANSARSVYSGLIRVEKGAAGSNAFQTNRNLVLHEGAHADSVPNLEIEENDVRCSHASAVGPIAEDQRFYLESRGVPPKVAGRLIASGFLDEVIDELSPATLAGPIRRLIASKLASAEEAEPSAGGTGLSAGGGEGRGTDDG
jgi:Fe-S cluster assembly protein SufD